MPIHKVGNKWQWGSHGKKYSSRKGAEKQAAAAHAAGFHEETVREEEEVKVGDHVKINDPSNYYHGSTGTVRKLNQIYRRGNNSLVHHVEVRGGVIPVSNKKGTLTKVVHEETVSETLDKSATASDWIHDFVHSTDKRFAGKSRKERIHMALGAYYGKQNEEWQATNERLLIEVFVKKGAFHRWLGKSQDELITAADIKKGKAAGGHAAKMATFAQNFAHIGEETLTENLKRGSRVVATKDSSGGYEDKAWHVKKGTKGVYQGFQQGLDKGYHHIIWDSPTPSEGGHAHEPHEFKKLSEEVLDEVKKIHGPVNVLHIHRHDSPVDAFKLAKFHGATRSENIGGGGGEDYHNHTFPSHQHAADFERDARAHGHAYLNLHPRAAEGKWHPEYIKKII